MDTFEKQLRMLISAHPDSIKDRRVFRALLSDYFPQSTREVNLTMMAYESGIGALISKNSTADEIRYATIQNVMMRDFGCSSESAEWAISVWRYALGEAAVRVPSVISKPKVQHTARKTQTAIPANAKAYFESCGLETVDKRANGGCLWVIGDEDEISEYVDFACRKYKLEGQHWPGGGKATGYRDAWFTKSKG